MVGLAQVWDHCHFISFMRTEPKPLRALARRRGAGNRPIQVLVQKVKSPLGIGMGSGKTGLIGFD
jgi:hypothetical protein